MVTKNMQTNETIREMAKKAFPDKTVKEIAEFTDGMCNVTYRVDFDDGSASVLKVAAVGNEGRMLNEVNLMGTEVETMSIVKENNLAKVAAIQAYDTSRTICSGDYFFMELLEGKSFSLCQEKLSEEENAEIYRQMGVIERSITSHKGTQFGILGDKEHRYEFLYDFVYTSISNVLIDAKRKNIEIGIPDEDILLLLKKDQDLFAVVTQPVLVHSDMWEGNIIVKDGEVTGVIDWERAKWGEAFMDNKFRRHTWNEHFLEGYGQTTFTEEEMRRIHWYDVLLYITMMVEGFYRGFPDDSQYQWTKLVFLEVFDILNGKKRI